MVINGDTVVAFTPKQTNDIAKHYDELDRCEALNQNKDSVATALEKKNGVMQERLDEKDKQVDNLNKMLVVKEGEKVTQNEKCEIEKQELKDDAKTVKKQRNFLGVSTTVVTILLILALL